MISLSKSNIVLNVSDILSDPPLYEEDIPEGLWLCHNCRMTQTPVASTSAATSTVDTTQAGNETATASTDTASVPVQMPPTDTETAAAATVLLIAKKLKSQRSRSNSRISNCSDSSGTDKKPPVVPPVVVAPKIIATADPKRKPTPLDELIRAASIMNPRQFELPREMEIYDQFPGTDKSKFFYRRSQDL